MAWRRGVEGASSDTVTGRPCDGVRRFLGALRVRASLCPRSDEGEGVDTTPGPPDGHAAVICHRAGGGRGTRRADVPQEVIDFIRYCYQRRRIGWPELYDEMCGVAARGEFRGMDYDRLAALGVGFSLCDLTRLAAHRPARRRRRAASTGRHPGGALRWRGRAGGAGRCADAGPEGPATATVEASRRRLIGWQARDRRAARSSAASPATSSTVCAISERHGRRRHDAQPWDASGGTLLPRYAQNCRSQGHAGRSERPVDPRDVRRSAKICGVRPPLTVPRGRQAARAGAGAQARMLRRASSVSICRSAST